MEVSKAFEISAITEIKILSNVRLINKRDLNPIYSKDNLQVQFTIGGELKGNVTCYLCLDGFELSAMDRNYIFPLFTESMNILIGKQISQGSELNAFSIRLSPPKLSMIPREINSAFKNSMQKYELVLDGMTLVVLTEYSIEAIN